MKKKRGFTLKSGNNLGAKGRKPSNFKMMGASPAKQDDVVMAGLLPEVEVKDERDKIAYEDASRPNRYDITGEKRVTKKNLTTGVDKEVTQTYDEGKKKRLDDMRKEVSDYVQAGSELKGQARKDYMAKKPYGGMKGVTQTLKRENFKNRLMADNSEASIKQFEREFPGETHPANK